MKASQLSEIQTSRDMTEEFRGYNHNLRIGGGEFYEMKNLTSAYYPVLSQRHKRGILSYPASGVTHHPNGLIAKDALCYVDGTKLYIDNYEISGLTLTDSPKQLVSMGAYIIIMPDKKYVNTLDYTDKGSIEATFTTSGTVSYELCRSDGRTYTDVTVSDTEPSDPTNLMLWIDTSTTPHTLKQFSSTSGMWISLAETYVKIRCPQIASEFKQYDGVKISGIDPSTGLSDLNDQTSVIWDIYHDPGDENENRSEGTNDYIVVIGIIDYAVTQTSPLTISRTMPEMDFIIESENRLWGCRYGIASNGEVVNEIYASKLGDFKNWNCFMGVSTDSYVASCGTDGAWTGAITHLGYPCFFKENYLHKVYGNFPSNYQIQTTALRGVQKGAGRSLAIVNEILYYKARNGICAYDGSLPTEVSAAFGDIHYSAVDETLSDFLRNGAVGGAFQNKYYVSMKSEVDGEWYFFVYDTLLGTWHKEDETRVDDFCACRNDLYFIDHETGEIKTVLGSGTEESGATEWYAETGVLGSSMPDKKYMSRLLFRMALGEGAVCHIEAQYDSDETWRSLAIVQGVPLKTFTIPVRPRRCDHLKIRFYGSGDIKLYSITKTLEQGSDLR